MPLRSHALTGLGPSPEGVFRYNNYKRRAALAVWTAPTVPAAREMMPLPRQLVAGGGDVSWSRKTVVLRSRREWVAR